MSKQILARRPDGTFVHVPARLKNSAAWRIHKLVEVREDPKPQPVAPIEARASYPVQSSTDGPLPEVEAADLAPKRPPGRPRKNQNQA